ncbi:uncharacterized protein OCT59_014485 [Rhizophagus irregularis]|nr:hypothetical protein OCT59_014485 [Rhizophagus irregularis]
MLEKLKLDRIGVTMSFDGWTNVREQELMGTMLVTSDGQPFAWQAKDISCERATTTEVMSKTEGMISEINKMKITLLAIVTDSAPAYNAARYFTQVLEMAKLRADINYNRRNDQQKSANNTMTKNKNKNKNDNENEIRDENENERYLQNEELNDNDLNNDQGSMDLKENLNSQFNDHLNEWLEELQQEENDEYDGEHDEYSESEKDFSDINVEDIEHPAENIDAKWKLEFMFEDNLCNPFNV